MIIRVDAVNNELTASNLLALINVWHVLMFDPLGEQLQREMATGKLALITISFITAGPFRKLSSGIFIGANVGKKLLCFRHSPIKANHLKLFKYCSLVCHHERQREEEEFLSACFALDAPSLSSIPEQEAAQV